MSWTPVLPSFSMGTATIGCKKGDDAKKDEKKADEKKADEKKADEKKG